MLLKFRFRQPKNELEQGGRPPAAPAEQEGEVSRRCPQCGQSTHLSRLWESYYVCSCGHNLRLNARQRLAFLTDADSFEELFPALEGTDLLRFPGYQTKLDSARDASKEREAVVCGTAAIGGEECALFVMEPYFMMGSMGMAVGEKITRLFEYARDHSLPVVGCAVSGGARMQEGILSLMQMAKTSGAVKLHSDGGNFYLALLTHPTTGGVTASFAMQADVILAEPGAVVGFAGPRVVEQTVRKRLPPDFQKAEVLLEHGFLDAIVPRSQQRAVISMLLAAHKQGGNP